MVHLLHALLATARSSLRPQRKLALADHAALAKSVLADLVCVPAEPHQGPRFHRLLVPYDSAPKYVLRDRDKIHGADFVRRVRAMGIEQVLTAPQSPWQNPYCERVIGTLRRDFLDQIIVLPMVGGLHHRYTRRAAYARASVPTGLGHERALRGLREATG